MRRRGFRTATPSSTWNCRTLCTRRKIRFASAVCPARASKRQRICLLRSVRVPTPCFPSEGPDRCGANARGASLSVGRRRVRSTRADYEACRRASPSRTRGARGETVHQDNLVRFVDAKGNATAFGYDAMDRRRTRTDALLRVETTVYDRNGNPTSFTDRKGQVSATVYDALDRPTQTTWADGSRTTRTYDAGDRLLTASEFDAGATVARHTVTRQYDGLDRRTRETVPLGRVDYTYTATSLRQSMTVNGQPQVSYAWDAASRLTSITQGAGATARTVSFAYDAASRTSSSTLANGLVASYGYDAASQLTSITYAKAGATVGTLTYGYDAGGRRTTIGGSLYESFLPTATTANAVYDANNKLTSWNGVAHTYDNNGSLTADGAKTYVWDARNRLKQIRQGATVLASFEYDAMGRRTRKTVGTAVTQYLYDGANAVQELTVANTVSANVLGGLAMDQWLLRSEGATTRHFLTDALGSTRALSDDAAAIRTRYQYEPYGESRATGDASTNSNQYTGRESDGTGLYFYRARYYHPGSKRFISEDPIGLSGGHNLYEYVHGQPTAYKDSEGTQVTFGHGARHMPNPAAAAAAERAIVNAVTPILPQTTPGAGFWGRVSVGGTQVTYRAMPIGGGICNIGTYYPR